MCQNEQIYKNCNIIIHICMYIERRLTSLILPKNAGQDSKKYCTACRMQICYIGYKSQGLNVQPCCADLARSGHQAKHAKNYYVQAHG